MQLLAGLALLGSGACVLVGLVLTSQATIGVGLIAVACYLGIVVRVIQASGQHDDVLRKLKRLAADPPKVVPLVAPGELGPLEIRCKACGVIGQRGPDACPHCGKRYA